VENGKKKAKLMGWDKGSLTKQQMKQTVTTTILTEYTKQRNAQSNSNCWIPMCSRAVINFSSTQNPA